MFFVLKNRGYLLHDKATFITFVAHKKSQKTPLAEIEKALKIKEAYYADKQSQNSGL